MKRAFTLIEILIVMVIIGVLFAIAIPQINRVQKGVTHEKHIIM